MPPRTFYNSPRASDYIVYATTYFPSEAFEAEQFIAEKKLPYIKSIEHMACYLGISASLIRQVIHNKKYHYRFFKQKKKSGKERSICSPKTYLKVIQWWICDNILSSISINEFVHGFARGRSFVTNANYHYGASHILNVDIKEFFDNIKFIDIKNVFRKIGYSDDAAKFLAELCSLSNCAPTGAPTSPLIANILLMDLDLAIGRLCNVKNIKYTRYADDLTFSSSTVIEKNFLDEIESIISNNGFNLNPSKTRFMGRGDRMEVTGLVVNSKVWMSRQWRNRTRGYLHRVMMDPSKYLDDYAKICGLFSSIKQFDPDAEKTITKSAQRALTMLISEKKKQ